MAECRQCDRVNISHCLNKERGGPEKTPHNCSRKLRGSPPNPWKVGTIRVWKHPWHCPHKRWAVWETAFPCLPIVHNLLSTIRREFSVLENGFNLVQLSSSFDCPAGRNVWAWLSEQVFHCESIPVAGGAVGTWRECSLPRRDGIPNPPTLAKSIVGTELHLNSPKHCGWRDLKQVCRALTWSQRESRVTCLPREDTFGKAAKICQADEIKPNELLNLF